VDGQDGGDRESEGWGGQDDNGGESRGRLGAEQKDSPPRRPRSTGNAGSGLGFPNLKNTNRGIYEVLTGGLAADQAVVDTGIEGLGLIPSGQRLAGAEVELVDAERREYRLKDTLLPLGERYDFILIDAPPSLGILTVNALTAAGSVLVPVQCEYYALERAEPPARRDPPRPAGLNPALQIEACS